MADKWKRKMQRARKLHRPSLRDWERDRLFEKFPSFALDVSEPNRRFQSFIPLEGRDETRNQMPVVLDAKKITENEFFSKYEATETPCLIESIPAGYEGGRITTPWPALVKWSFQALKNDSTLKGRKFKCGEDDDGRSIKVKLKYFLEYLEWNCDDSPLYVFDSRFDDDYYAKSILSDYCVPSYFRDDLFRLVSESRRPPYRWFLVGPERSGTCVHIDPLATSAWNTLVVGKKRWVLFPPQVPKHVVKGRGLIGDLEDDEAIHYFMYILPRIKGKAASMKHHADYRHFACFEFTQNAGETVFIPSGWWHAVLNLTHTVGVTQNFCSPRNFEKVWMKTRTGRKRLAWKWLCQLDQHYPELAARARFMNERDHFRMKYAPEEIQRREQQRRLEKQEV